jgi:uncharacterized membrane protein YdjX (TVP38/TMEM64 family)
MIAQSRIKANGRNVAAKVAKARSGRRQVDRRISIAAGIVIGIALTVLVVIGPKTGSVDNLRESLLNYGPWAVAISAGLTVAQAIIAPLPGNVITITNALVFGPIWGSLLSWAATLLGASLCFMLAKTFGKPFAAKIVGGSLARAEEFFKKYGFYAMFAVRIMPFVPFDAISYGAGLVGVPFSRFLLATAVGIIPSILIYSYLGTMIAGFYWWVVLALLVLALVGIIAASRWERWLKPAPAAVRNNPVTTS